MQMVRAWVRKTNTRNVGQLFGTAYLRAATVPKAVKGLQWKMISPYRQVLHILEHPNNRTNQKLLMLKQRLLFVVPIWEEEFVDPPNEEWVKCGDCGQWWHEDWSSYESCGQFN
uniref:Uncharacterized protein n=1 Tax=Timema douglasi TaxID=61478 RepID=A0A7R8VIU0_TIMDO|nr:unnamed protein product [Timema douglasi]